MSNKRCSRSASRFLFPARDATPTLPCCSPAQVAFDGLLRTGEFADALRVALRADKNKENISKVFEAVAADDK